MSAERDIRADLAARLGKFPNLKTFLESLPAAISAVPEVLDLVTSNDNAITSLLGLMDDVVNFQNNRYNREAANAQAHTDHAAQLQTANAQLQQALTRAEIERDIIRDIRSNNGDTGSGGHDGTLPYAKPFDGEEKDTGKRTREFRT
jgi:hypothetical protein